MIYWVIFCLY